MHDEKTFEPGQESPQRPSAQERYAQERKALLLANDQDGQEDPLLENQLKYDIFPLGSDL